MSVQRNQVGIERNHIVYRNIKEFGEKNKLECLYLGGVIIGQKT